MPRKINKRKLLQAARRKTVAEEDARKIRRWPGTRRRPDEGPQEPCRVGMIAHHHCGGLGLAMALLAAEMLTGTTPMPQKGSE